MAIVHSKDDSHFSHPIDSADSGRDWMRFDGHGLENAGVSANSCLADLTLTFN